MSDEKTNQLDHYFIWRERGGNLVSVFEMETSHLFYTLRMIWNNTCPPILRVGKVKLYEFSDYYTTEYLRDAVKVMYAEIKQRSDIRADWYGELSIIEANASFWFNQKLGEDS